MASKKIREKLTTATHDIFRLKDDLKMAETNGRMLTEQFIFPKKKSI